ncbi:hypothetical protein P245_15245 [Comamonas thiooxydans]|uniref:Uncharacterized protein n=1 Tax=Comamonas thiooxydans TaxID=363952 RepID=A0A0E3C0V4_9BURK|nr:hypothetical protein P245_15245 [Comamonas thiooxydans]
MPTDCNVCNATRLWAEKWRRIAYERAKKVIGHAPSDPEQPGSGRGPESTDSGDAGADGGHSLPAGSDG